MYPENREILHCVQDDKGKVQDTMGQFRIQRKGAGGHFFISLIISSDKCLR